MQAISVKNGATYHRDTVTTINQFLSMFNTPLRLKGIVKDSAAFIWIIQVDAQGKSVPLAPINSNDEKSWTTVSIKPNNKE